jgi:hypothetical protein
MLQPLHVLSFSRIVLVIQTDIVVASNHEFQLGIDALKHLQRLRIFVKMPDHGQVAAVEEHVRFRKRRAEGRSLG